MYLYRALSGIQSAQTWITQFYVQITPRLPLFASVHQMAPALIEVADIHCSLLLIYRPRVDERLSWPDVTIVTGAVYSDTYWLMMTFRRYVFLPHRNFGEFNLSSVWLENAYSCLFLIFGILSPKWETRSLKNTSSSDFASNDVLFDLITHSIPETWLL